MLCCAGGAAGGGYAQVIPMEEVRQRGWQQVPVPLGGAGRLRWLLQRFVSGNGLHGELERSLPCPCGPCHLHMPFVRQGGAVDWGCKNIAQILYMFVTSRLSFKCFLRRGPLSTPNIQHKELATAVFFSFHIPIYCERE